jgi:uncharacterized protein YndB with AHSA1/START domain
VGEPLGERTRGMRRDRTIDLSVEVPGTVEEVWEAIATGPGISSWFIPHEVDGREGGEVVMDFGSFGRETATVERWEPPHRVVFRGPDSERGPGLAYEWLVEASGGGACVVRLVNSGFGPGEEWDADFDGMSTGWRIFMENLRLHLIHFRGQVAHALVPTVMTPGPGVAAWERLCAALGVPASLEAGDHLGTTGEGVPRLAGRVETAAFAPAVRTYHLLLDEPAPGTAFVTVEGAGDVVAASAYLYLYCEAPGVDDAWSSWLRSALPEVPAPAEA